MIRAQMPQHSARPRRRAGKQGYEDGCGHALLKLRYGSSTNETNTGRVQMGAFTDGIQVSYMPHTPDKMYQTP